MDPSGFGVWADDCSGIAKNGVDVGEMLAKLLKSIEEMTLQMIALKKENDRLSEKLKKLASYVGKTEN